MPALRRYARLLRVHQYVKNVFILLPLFFGGGIQDTALLIKALAAFGAFCMIASSVYICNDLTDAEDDRLHPVKRLRPIASGEIDPATARVICSTLMFAGIGSAYMLGQGAFMFSVIYVVINALYTFRLKHVAIIDVSLVAACYVIRLYVGSAVTGVPLSAWIIVMTFLLALFLSLAKRRDDMVSYLYGLGGKRTSLDGYSIELLNAAMQIMASVVIVAYLMYTISHEVTARVGSDKFYLTAFWVIVGILRYFRIAYHETGAGAPTMVLMTDKFLQATVAGWIVSCAVIIYG